MKDKTLRYSGPRWLPRVRLHGVEYFVDERLREFRDVTDPHRAIGFGSERGRMMLKEFFVVECQECGLEVGIAIDTREHTVECARCGHSFAVGAM